MSFLGFKNYSNPNKFGNLAMLLLGFFFIYLLATSGPHGTNAFWIFIYPPAAFYLLNRRAALLYSGLLFMIALIILPLQAHIPQVFHYDSEFKINFLCSFLVVGTLTCALKSFKSGYLQGIEKSQLNFAQEKEIPVEAKKSAESDNNASMEFLANMSHEFRTPLNHISGFTELVVDQKFGELNDIQKEYLNDALQSSKYLLALINDVLDLQGAETGKQELEISEIDIHTLLENSLTMIRERALNHGIQISKNISIVSKTIRADQRKLQQVLYNLLSNAAKFTPDGGSVTVSAQWVERNYRRVSRNGGAEVLGIIPNPEQIETPAGIEYRKYLEFVVADTGIGIKPVDRERIFNRFEQADGSSQKKFQGAGLGLSLSKSYVELHGGRIWVESEGEGKGSTFRFIIPASPEKENENNE